MEMYKPNNKLILKNTMMLYFRQLLTLFVSLYTVRIVLNVLGVEDYGIYSVVAGLVSFFTFLKGGMSSATQRFFSFSMGKNNFKELEKIFSINITIYLLIGIISLILLEIFGLWFLKEQLNVPPERIDSAILIYHFSVIAFFFNIVSSPFLSAILAHEDMSIYAYVSLLEVILKLLIVILLSYLVWDKLELYGFLTLVVSVIVCFVYLIICIRKYDECQFKHFYWDKKMFIEIIGFTSWTLFGQLSNVLRFQAVLVLLNQFFNPVVVAANAIARNITMQIQLFSNNFNTSLYPPIIKAYSSDDKKNMFSLIFNGSKITFFLMWIFTLPFYIEMEMILKLWLKEIPPHTILFTRLALIEVLINSISLPISTAARAPGRMKIYELTLGMIQIAIFVFSWIALKSGSPAYMVFVIAIIANIIMFFVRLVLVRKMIGLSLKLFWEKVILPVLGIILFTSIPMFALKYILPNELIFSLMNILFCFLFILTFIYYLGLDKIWREKIQSMILKKITNH